MLKDYFVVGFTPLAQAQSFQVFLVSRIQSELEVSLICFLDDMICQFPMSLLLHGLRPEVADTGKG